jgi:acetate---CoA ligase (ADP-forming)
MSVYVPVAIAVEMCLFGSPDIVAKIVFWVGLLDGGDKEKGMGSLAEIMESGSVAVIGASRDPQKTGALLLRVLREVGFKGPIAGVNPQGGEVFSIPLYRSMEEVPFGVDLAVLHIPPPAVPEVLKDCARKGVKGVVISAEGFAETGPAGANLQEQVKSILRVTGMRALGPNTLGIINTATGLTTSYLATPAMLQPGPVGIIAQSGIFVGALLRYLCSLDGLKLSKGIGLGNKVDVDEADALEYLLEDEKTQVIGMYLEDVRDGRRFLQAARKASARKPVLLIKGGRTKEGARASISHTASLAVADDVFDGALRQAGVLRLSGIDDFIATLKGFLFMPLPRGKRVALITYSGAQGILSIDAAVEAGLELARLGEGTRKRLSRLIAAPSKTQNPIDIFPDMLTHGAARTAKEVLSALVEDEGVDMVVFISFAESRGEAYGPVADRIREFCPKPVFFSVMGAKSDIEGCQGFLERKFIPCFPFPEVAIRVLARMWQYAQRKKWECGCE